MALQTLCYFFGGLLQLLFSGKFVNVFSLQTREWIGVCAGHIGGEFITVANTWRVKHTKLQNDLCWTLRWPAARVQAARRRKVVQ